jgi:hypothetical protein
MSHMRLQLLSQLLSPPGVCLDCWAQCSNQGNRGIHNVASTSVPRRVDSTPALGTVVESLAYTHLAILQVITCTQLAEHGAAAGLWPVHPLGTLPAACVTEIRITLVMLMTQMGEVLCFVRHCHSMQ